MRFALYTISTISAFTSLTQAVDVESLQGYRALHAGPKDKYAGEYAAPPPFVEGTVEKRSQPSPQHQYEHEDDQVVSADTEPVIYARHQSLLQGLEKAGYDIDHFFTKTIPNEWKKEVGRSVDPYAEEMDFAHPYHDRDFSKRSVEDNYHGVRARGPLRKHPILPHSVAPAPDADDYDSYEVYWRAVYDWQGAPVQRRSEPEPEYESRDELVYEPGHVYIYEEEPSTPRHGHVHHHHRPAKTKPVATPEPTPSAPAEPSKTSDATTHGTEPTEPPTPKPSETVVEAQTPASTTTEAEAAEASEKPKAEENVTTLQKRHKTLAQDWQAFKTWISGYPAAMRKALGID